MQILCTQVTDPAELVLESLLDSCVSSLREAMLIFSVLSQFEEM